MRSGTQKHDLLADAQQLLSLREGLAAHEDNLSKRRMDLARNLTQTSSEEVHDGL